MNNVQAATKIDTSTAIPDNAFVPPAGITAVRDEEGYMARVEADGEDWLLIEDHCPICAAARTCQGFCRSELQLFQEVVGPHASIVREQHVLANAMRCVYRIRTLP